MSLVKISVIIAVFNGEKFLVETLESIANQTFEDWECWIVDDGSTDRTIEIVKDFLRKDQRFQLIPTHGGNGPYVAANLAITKCSGEFIARTDADDVILPERLEVQYNIMSNNPNIQVAPAGWLATFRSTP